MFGLVGLYDPEAAEGQPPGRVAYVGPGGFDDHLRDASNLRVERVSLEAALAQFRAGEVDGVVEELAGPAGGARNVTLLLPDGELRTSLLLGQLKGLLRAYERDLRLERSERLETPVLYVEGPDDASPYYAFTYGVLIPLLLLTPAFLGGAIAADSIVQEIQTRTLQSLRAAPVSAAGLLAGKLLVPVLLAPAQFLLWAILLRLNGLLLANLFVLLAFAAALALLLASASALIAVWARDEGRTQALYALFVLVALAASNLLPQSPFNVVARLAAGAADPGSYAVVAGAGVLAASGFAIAALVWRRRIEADLV